ncbi:hypothetical protein VFPPC_18487 [Pochonia chlamydosporia 170]|uniref:Uncharacterized protein n=1 Tax=Pochonia chlamydosporia 170 TaxID=1380566 RepID=A0A219ANG8_METCM|nr:hypothetical protein VFPPC_18487 [Pochonia chlamydosporia 170]OWT42376.1 hypothetical protein VFPPC_18487 [Pochonia chlamydosporia 170]
MMTSGKGMMPARWNLDSCLRNHSKLEACSLLTVGTICSINLQARGELLPHFASLMVSPSGISKTEFVSHPVKAPYPYFFRLSERPYEVVGSAIALTSGHVDFPSPVVNICSANGKLWPLLAELFMNGSTGYRLVKTKIYQKIHLFLMLAFSNGSARLDFSMDHDLDEEN